MLKAGLRNKDLSRRCNFVEILYFSHNAQWISTFDDFRVLCCSWRMLSLLAICFNKGTSWERVEGSLRLVYCQSGACTGQVGPVWGGWQWAGRARPFLPCQPGLGRRCQPGKTGVDILAASVFFYFCESIISLNLQSRRLLDDQVAIDTILQQWTVSKWNFIAV